MDEHQIDPGDRWMQEIQNIIAIAPAAAIFLGEHGLGAWQEVELESCYHEHQDRGIPIIPIPLHGVPDGFKPPPFLKNFSWLDLRPGLTPDALDRLAAKIKAERIAAPEGPPPATLHGPRRHNLPFVPLNDLFKGRDEDLQSLEASLASPTSTATAITQAIHGLGGIGKTRLAIEYAWRSGDRYDARLFVVADSPEALQSGLAGLARLNLSGLSPSPSRAQDEDVAAVLGWFRDHDRWLLILDNVDTPEAAEAVRNILPQLQSGHVLITSRRKNWPPGIRKQSLDELKLEEATAFLLQRTEEARSKTTDDPQQAENLAKILDGLPLALEQAAAYIAHHQMTFAEYLSIWEKEKTSVLDWLDEDQTQYPHSVATTWQTTFRQLGPTAAAILRLTAYLAPDPIPVEMFEKEAEFVVQGAKWLSEETGKAADSKPIREGVAELAAYSMVTRQDRTATVHRVVQEVLRTRIPPESRRDWIELALRLVNDFAPLESEDVRTWPVWNLLRPHAAEVIRYGDEAGIANPTSQLMNQLELHLWAKGLYNEAEPLLRREEWILSNPSKLTRALNSLALLLQHTNRFEEAEHLLRGALAIDEDALGSQHPSIARDLNNLAQLVQDTNRMAEAEPLMRRALTIDEEAFGKKHPEVATALNNLARLLQATNRLAQAEPLMRRAVEIIEVSLGPDHPNSKIMRGNLAGLLAAIESAKPGKQERPATGDR
jgi:tetratricopeptide (TPR) repeat protein